MAAGTQHGDAVRHLILFRPTVSACGQLCIHKTNDTTKRDGYFYTPAQAIGMRPWLVTGGHIVPENSNCPVMKKCHFMNHIEMVCSEVRWFMDDEQHGIVWSLLISLARGRCHQHESAPDLHFSETCSCASKSRSLTLSGLANVGWMRESPSPTSLNQLQS